MPMCAFYLTMARVKVEEGSVVSVLIQGRAHIILRQRCLRYHRDAGDQLETLGHPCELRPVADHLEGTLRVHKHWMGAGLAANECYSWNQRIVLLQGYVDDADPLNVRISRSKCGKGLSKVMIQASSCSFLH